MTSIEALAEARLRRHARKAGEIIKKSRGETGHEWHGGRYRYLIVSARNVAVAAGDDPDTLLARYARCPQIRQAGELPKPRPEGRMAG